VAAVLSPRLTIAGRLSRTLPLVIVLGLVASASEASPPAPRRSSGPAAKAPTKATPIRTPVRKQLALSPQVVQRLSRPTVQRAAVEHVPLSKKEVRERVPASQRPPRSVSGKVRRATNAELTTELNKIEKQLNGYGYSLRDEKTAVYHEHKPNRALLDKQVGAVRRVADTKPKRKPLSHPELRARVQREAKPVPRAARPNTPLNQLSSSPGSGLSASADFDWSPMLGETNTASSYLSAHASFSGDTGGFTPGMRGNVSISTGAYVLGERYEAFRLDADFTSPLDGSLDAELNATLMGGYQQPLVDANDQHALTFERSHTLYDGGLIVGTTLFIAGFPVSIDVIVSPSLRVAYGAELRPGMVVATVKPNVKLEARLEAYLDLWLIEAGGGGSVTLIDTTPGLVGAAYLDEVDGHPAVTAELYGWIHTRFLDGRVYAFIEFFFGPRLEWELANYEGWEWLVPVFRHETAI
jgi:hypothetical protein